MPASLRAEREVRRVPLADARDVGDCLVCVVLEGREGGEREGKGVSVVGSGVDDEVFDLGADLEAVFALAGVFVVDFHGDDFWL